MGVSRDELHLLQVGSLASSCDTVIRLVSVTNLMHNSFIL
jgi:hypothetical protein